MANRNLFCGLVLFAASVGVSAAWGWQPAEGPLKTRWTQEVSPEKVRPEYPRPQMVRKSWVNLNGLWQYAIRPAGEETPAKWDGEILVPFPIESALSGVKKPVQPDQRLWYRRSFSWTPSDSDQRLLLHFGAVDWKCTVWVNGKKVGEHTGGYDPFTFDITAALRKGENELTVAVTDPTDTGYQPRGKQMLHPHGIWYTAVTGIWQTVWLEPVAKQHIESLKIVPNVDRKTVTVTIQATDGAVRLQVFEPSASGKQALVGDKSSTSGKPIEVTLQNVKLWSPDQPYLYDLQVELIDGTQVVDTVQSYFGMRKNEVKRDASGINRLWLNNEVLFQFGPLDQGWWPDGLYTAPTDAALKYDIEMTKRLGMNMARKHVKVEPDRWYYWCDKLGLMVWQDMPSGETGRNEEAKANFRRELQAMIDARGNHPSIVMWVPFNEGWGQHDTPEIVRWIKEYDPSRLVDEASGWTDTGSGDVSDMHKYPGPGMRDPEKNRACVLGEFGGLGMPVRGHTWQQEKNWGYVSYSDREKLADAYLGLLTAMRPLIARGLCAAVYTQTTDVEIEVNGLMTYDREITKMDPARLKKAAEKLYLPTAQPASDN
jgi:beta-galactosidase/beta-glucuronidase